MYLSNKKVLIIEIKNLKLNNYCKINLQLSIIINKEITMSEASLLAWQAKNI